MPVNSKHPEYQKEAPNWEVVRDVLDGEEAIKGKKQKYLPVPPGMVVANGVAFENGRKAAMAYGDDRYAFYHSFAEFPEITAPALNGFQGIIHEKSPKVQLPTAMEYLIEDATPDGEPLEVLWQAITHEVLSAGRIGLVCDVFDDDLVRIVPYAAESIINWRLRSKRDGGDPEFVVLEECMEAPHPDDEYMTKEKKSWRELRLMNADSAEPFYAVQKWKEDDEGGEPKPDGPLRPILRFGAGLGYVPIKIINAVDCGFEYGTIPIMPLCRRSLSIYRLTADYRRALYMKGDPQPWIAGVDPESSEAPGAIGGSTVWCFTDPSAKAAYLDVDGAGIPLTKEAMDSEYDRFYEEGGRLLADSDNGAESGEALRRRQIAKHVTLKGIVVNAADGLQSVLRKIAEMIGEDPEAVIFEAATDFSEPAMSGKELLELTTAKNAGAVLSARSIHRLARRGGLTELEFEEELEEMQDDPATMTGMTGMPGDEPAPETDTEEPADDEEVEVDDEAGDDEETTG